MSRSKISDFYEDLDRVLFDELDAEELIEAINAELETLAEQAAKGEDVADELVELRRIRRSARELRS